MQNNKLLIAVLLLLAVASFFVLQSKDTGSKANQEHFLIPELQSVINEVNSIVISKNKQTITLSKQDDIWQLAESDNYVADANKIATLLIELRNFTLKEKKTSNAQNYEKLDLSENLTTKIVLKSSKGQFADVSIGKSSQRGQGTYVRKNSEKQTWLATGKLAVKLDSKDWIVTTIIDIESSKIKSVNYKPENADSFTINKVTPADTAFMLENIPKGMQIKPGVDLSTLATSLQQFSVESAVKKAELPVETKTMTVTYQLFSGMEYQLNLYKKDDEYLLDIDVSNVDSNSSFAKQLEKWQFVIPKFKYDALNKSLIDIIGKIPPATPITTEAKD